MSHVTVYTTEPCGYCRVAKALLNKRGIPFEEINLAKDPGERNPMDISYDSVSWTVYLAKECRRASELLGGRTVSRPAEPLLDFQLRGRLAGETT